MSKRKEIEAVSYIEPKEACKILQMTSANLRKYADMIEKQTNDPSYFARNERNARLYTNDNIATLLRVNTIKNSGSIALEEAINQALGVSSNNEIAVDAIATGLRLEEQEKQNKLLFELVKKQSEQINEQSNQIGQLKDTVQSLTDSHINTSNQFKELLEVQKTLLIEQTKPIEPSSKKKGLFSRFF